MFMEPTQTWRQGGSGRLRLLISKKCPGDTPCPISMPVSACHHIGHLCPWKRYSGVLDLAGMETSAINQKMCVFSPIRRFFFPFLFYHFHPSTLSALAFCWLSDCVYFLLLYPHPLTYIHLCVAVGAPGEIFPHPKKSQLKIHLGNQRCLDVISL